MPRKRRWPTHKQFEKIWAKRGFGPIEEGDMRRKKRRTAAVSRAASIKSWRTRKAMLRAQYRKDVKAGLVEPIRKIDLNSPRIQAALRIFAEWESRTINRIPKVEWKL